MPSTDHSSTMIYDIIFVGGTLLLSIRDAVVLTLGSGGAAACVTAGRLAEADPCLKILVSAKKVYSISIFSESQFLRSSKLVHILVMSQIIYSRHAALAALCVPQKHLRFM